MVKTNDILLLGVLGLGGYFLFQSKGIITGASNVAQGIGTVAEATGEQVEKGANLLDDALNSPLNTLNTAENVANYLKTEEGQNLLSSIIAPLPTAINNLTADQKQTILEIANNTGRSIGEKFENIKSFGEVGADYLASILSGLPLSMSQPSNKADSRIGTNQVIISNLGMVQANGQPTQKQLSGGNFQSMTGEVLNVGAPIEKQPLASFLN